MFRTNHEEQFKIVSDKNWEEIEKKIEKSRVYNPITTSLYDNKKEENFLKEREENQANWGKDFKNRFPPSWKYREPLILDTTKVIPEEVLMVQKQKEEKKNRFKVKYELENQYRVYENYLGKRN